MKNERLLRQIYTYISRNTSLIFLILDREWRVREANEYAMHLMGMDIINAPVHDLIVDFHGMVNINLLQEDSTKTHLINVKTVNGLPQTFYFRFFDIGESIIAFGEINSAEIETLRENLLLVNNELSNLTRELHKKNAELAKLNELKNQYLGMAAHDLRTPIGAISLYSDFLIDEASDRLEGEHIKFLSSIKSLSEFMLAMLSDILDISAIESGKLTLDVKKCNVVSVVSQSLVLNRFLAEKKQITLLLKETSPMPDIYIDESKIKQVMDNLVTNAIKFSPPDTTVEINVIQDNETILISIKDEGQGIPEEDLKKLFKPFSKTSVRGTAGEKSTGLGLAIAHRIITAHKGNVWAESTAGKGTTFSFSLPAGKNNLEDEI